jgi:hypothetical protein
MAAAILWTLWNSGLRAAELLSLNVDEVELRNDLKGILHLRMARGNRLKTGARPVAITDAAPTLRLWLGRHPAASNPGESPPCYRAHAGDLPRDHRACAASTPGQTRRPPRGRPGTSQPGPSASARPSASGPPTVTQPPAPDSHQPTLPAVAGQFCTHYRPPTLASPNVGAH